MVSVSANSGLYWRVLFIDINRPNKIKNIKLLTIKNNSHFNFLILRKNSHSQKKICHFERERAVLAKMLEIHFEREKAFEVEAFEVGRTL